MGSSIVFPFYFPETVSTMKAIQRYKCKTLRGVPTQFIDLLNHPDRANYDLSSLENLIAGGRFILFIFILSSSPHYICNFIQLYFFYSFNNIFYKAHRRVVKF
jgi:hypothetical protein